VAGRWQGIKDRIGFRGSFLLFLFVLDTAYAGALYQEATPQLKGPAEHAPDLLLPPLAWAGIWLVVGLVCLWGAFRAADRVPFACAAALKVSWGLVSLVLWIRMEQVTGWLSFVVWGTFAVTVLIVSSWPEPPPLRILERTRK
jgi:hypothetical protein